MNLVIVESPTKARTLSSFLGKNYRVEATLGHIRDLPEKKLGVDVAQDFEPFYIIIPGKKKRVFQLKKIAKGASRIILATDPDREGEAIAYHVAVLLLGEKALRVAQGKSKARIPHFRGDVRPKLCSKTNSDSSLTLRKTARMSEDKKRVGDSGFSEHSETTRLRSLLSASGRNTGIARLIRIIFHEITRSAIEEALKNPREIDMKLVNAQVARRVLDRLVGYKLSPLLWKKIGKRWLSAGRVQSVAARLIVEREREREGFKTEEYWRINSTFQKSKIKNQKLKLHIKNQKDKILAELVAKDGEKYERIVSFNLFDGKYQVAKTTIKNKAEAEEIISDFQDRRFNVASVDEKEVKRLPPPPFTTSTLQQEANMRLGFSSKKTMSLAQRLYERGLITYHRTDSVFLAEKFLQEAQKFIKKVYGEKYAPQLPRRYKTKSKLAQEAHEAIRPTKLEARSLKLEASKDLTKDHSRLYEVIFKRAVASQAKEAIIDTTKVGILSDNGYLFEAKGSVIKFDGFLKILGASREDKILPKVKVGNFLELIETTPFQHFTTPPPRYTEATLIKTLEKLGIGRPSTYAPILSTIGNRQYVEKEEGRFAPTLLGETVNDFLTKHFPKIIDIPFTAQMEDSLDGIAKGEEDWVPVVKEFYTPFESRLKKVYLQAEKVKLPAQETGEKCPKCGSKVVVKIGKFGKFLACSSFPKCNFTAPFLEKTGISCPECGGEVVIKKTKKGKRFYGCSNYPKCQFASWRKPKREGKKLN